MKENNTLPIRIICATRGSKENFFNTKTGKSIQACQKITKYELNLFSENSEGLSKVYNIAIEDSKNKPAILVFIHDDILLGDFYYGKRISEGLQQYDIVGCAGCKKRHDKQPSWCHMYYEKTKNKFLFHNHSNLSGAIGHGESYPEIIDYYGETHQECALLDGVLLAAKSTTLLENDLRYDEDFKFHFYDLDFCRTAELKGLKMGTIDLSLIHASAGNFGNLSWQEAYEKYIQKWNA